MKMILKKQFQIKLFLLLSMAVFTIGSLFSYVYGKEKMDYIRVGLTKEFHQKSSLSIKNKELKMGFSKQDVFYGIEYLRAKKGFQGRVVKENLYELEGEYGTYKEAKGVAKAREGGIAVLIGAGRKGGIWKVYTDSFGAGNMISLFRIKREFLEVSFDGEKFLADVEKMGGYPQFEAANRNVEKLIFLEGKRYRGRIEIGSYGRIGVTAVNIVKVDDYVRGVVPVEVGYQWPMAALKAQAVCARSFAVATAGFRADSDRKKGYRLNNTSHQSYGGYDVEGERPNRAVKETLGELLTYRNRVVRAFYYSTSGGATETSENVWNKKVKHIDATSDIYENKPEKRPWTIRFSREEIENKLLGKKTEEGSSLGRVQKIEVDEYSPSGRVLKLRIVGSLGSIILKKQEIRDVFSLYSTKFEVFEGGQETDFVHVLYRKDEGHYQTKRNLRKKKVISRNGRITELRSDEEDGNQVILLSVGNRKGYYLGERKKGTFYFVGSGFGHGVGMSQSGARGMAEAGYGYKKILMHYFRGARVN